MGDDTNARLAALEEAEKRRQHRKDVIIGIIIVTFVGIMVLLVNGGLPTGP